LQPLLLSQNANFSNTGVFYLQKIDVTRNIQYSHQWQRGEDTDPNFSLRKFFSNWKIFVQNTQLWAKNLSLGEIQKQDKNFEHPLCPALKICSSVSKNSQLSAYPSFLICDATVATIINTIWCHHAIKLHNHKHGNRRASLNVFQLINYVTLKGVRKIRLVLKPNQTIRNSVGLP